MIRTIVLDDIPEQVETLLNHLRLDDRFALVGCYQHPKDALPVLNTDEIDLIFSDVEMPDFGGFDFLRSLSKKPDVIFVSAYPKYAIQSFEFEPLHFLSKPLQTEKVLEAIERAYLRITEKRSRIKPFLFVRISNSDFEKVNLEDIVYVEGSREYSKIHTTSKMLLAHRRMKEIERDLKGPEFMRIHRSYIVNTAFITSVMAYSVQINNDKKLPTGRTYRKHLKRKIGIV